MNGGTKARVLNIFEYVCDSICNFYKNLNQDIYVKEIFYYKILNKIDETKAIDKIKNSLNSTDLSSKSDYIINKRNQIRKKYNVLEEFVITDNLFSGITKFGGIESLFIESLEDNSQAVLFCKKDFSKYEINMIKYLFQSINFEAENKYIVALTESNEPLQRLCKINGVEFMRMGKSNLFAIQQYVQDLQTINEKILPELQHYLANYEKIKECLKSKRNGEYSFDDNNKLGYFMDYLRYFANKDEKSREN